MDVVVSRNEEQQTEGGIQDKGREKRNGVRGGLGGLGKGRENYKLEKRKKVEEKERRGRQEKSVAEEKYGLQIS